MSVEFHENDIHEDVFGLLLGLLDDGKAEELRRLIATDAEAAKVYAEGRKTLELTSRAVRIKRQVDTNKQTDGVIDFRTFERASGFAYDAAASSFEADLFQQSGELDASKANKPEAFPKRTKVRKDSKGKRKRKSQKDKGLVSDSMNKKSNKWFSCRNLWTAKKFIESKGASSARNFQKYYRKISLFQKIILGLTLFGIVVSVGIVWQEIRLRRFFKEDYCVRAIIPDALVRGLPQSIIVRTTNLENDSFRTSVRFDVVDANTNEFVLSHSELSNAGEVRYDLPNMEDFPDSVSLKISVGTKEDSFFETVLPVVNARKLYIRDLENSSQTISEAPEDPIKGSYAEGVTFASYQGREILERQLEELSADSLSEDTEEQQKNSNDSDNRNEGNSSLNVGIYPELGELIAGFFNRISIFCTDAAGEPVSTVLTLTNNEGTIDFETDEQGYGTFAFTPSEGRQYFLTSKLASKVELVGGYENNTLSEQEATPESSCYDADSAGQFDSSLAEETRGSETENKKATLFAVKSKGVYFRPTKSVLDEDEPIQLEVKSLNDEILVATIEKNGAIVSQLATVVAEGTTNVDIPLSAEVCGVLKTVVYKKDEKKELQKIGETYLYRNMGGNAPSFGVDWLIEEQTAENNVLSKGKQIVVDIEPRQTVSTRKNKVQASDREVPITLSVSWSSDIDQVSSKMTLDDVLNVCPDLLREKVLSTVAGEAKGASPILVDNILQVKSASASKLKDFRKREARTAGTIASFGLVVCAALALLAIFFVAFDALSIWKSLIVATFACVLGFFFCLEQRMLDYSSILTASLGLTEESATLDKEPWTVTKCLDSDVSLWKGAEIRGNEPFERELKVSAGKTTFVFDELGVDECHLPGVVFVKVSVGANEAWTITVPKQQP